MGLAVQHVWPLHSRASDRVLIMSALLVLTRTVYFCFQCRALEAKLAPSQTGPGRVLWMSSHQAHPDAFDAEDWQDSPKPYEAIKFQMDLIRVELSHRWGPSALVRHFTLPCTRRLMVESCFT